MSHAITAARRVVDYARADAREIKRLRKEVAILKTQLPKREQYAQRTGPQLAQAVEDAMGSEDFARLRDYLVAQDRIQQQVTRHCRWCGVELNGDEGRLCPSCLNAGDMETTR